MPIIQTFLWPPPMSKKRKHPAFSSTTKRHRIQASQASQASRASHNQPNHPAFQNFYPKPFTPYLSSNPHFQTILSNYFPAPPPLVYQRFFLESDDGEATLSIDLANGTSLAPSPSHEITPVSVRSHTPYQHYRHLPKPPQPVVVVLHGLESNSSAIVTKRIVHACTKQNFKTFVLNFRSCANPNDVPTTLRLYHAGFTEDLETLLRAIKESAIETGYHPPDVYLCGFSLGSNIICQFLGRHGEHAQTVFHVVAAAGACVPFDPTACQQHLDKGLRGIVYSRRLVETMQQKFEAAFKAGIDIGNVVPANVRSADRVGLIDDYFISPVFGFKDRFDYYQKVDSRKVLKHITVPTFLVNARDDPFFDHKSGQSLPTDEQIGEAPVMFHLTDHGGHCGFLDRETFLSKSPGYFQSEFANFFSCVRQTMATQEHRTLAETQSPDKL